jgi:predicted N-formylglutamate amidohydrolase
MLSTEVPFIIITCEHGGNHIPRKYQSFFSSAAHVLHSHRGYDPGALDVAKKIAKKLNAPLVYETISRLLIDQNRSVRNKNIFSEFTNQLNSDEKNKIISTVYANYHAKVNVLIQQALDNHQRVIHLSIHSFTPVLNGTVRHCDIGLLYDPKRHAEKDLSTSIVSHIQSAYPNIRMRRNYPYKGISDGLVTQLRKKYPEQRYCGLEIECNQESFLQRKPLWDEICKALTETFLELFSN